MDTSIRPDWGTPAQISPYPRISAVAEAMGKPLRILDLEATTGDLKHPEFGVVELAYVIVHAHGSVDQDSYLVDPSAP